MIFDNVTVITMNPQRQILTIGAVVVKGNHIVALGKSDEIFSRFPEEAVIPCNSNVLMPGLIDHPRAHGPGDDPRLRRRPGPDRLAGEASLGASGELH